MKRNALAMPLLALSVAALISSCSDEQSADSAANTRAEVGESGVQAPSKTQAPSQAGDSVKPEDLKAGMEVMQPRASNFSEAFSKIEVLPTFRYFMHPGMDKDASIEFDTTGLASLKLSPYVGNLSGSSDCAGPGAGVVQLSWYLDDAEPVMLTVDRAYVGTIDVKVSNSHRLKLTVDKGNEEISCDWFSVGFVDVVSN